MEVRILLPQPVLRFAVKVGVFSRPRPHPTIPCSPDQIHPKKEAEGLALTPEKFAGRRL